MISYIRGELESVEEQKAVIDVGGIGYGVFMSGQSLSLLPRAGCEVKIYTYLSVKEDSMQLFGFLTKEEREMFRLIIGVSGIGPKGGLNILAVLSADELRFAVLSGDVKAISQAPGIGKRTAEKLILELRDKMDIESVLENAAHGGDGNAQSQDNEATGMQSEAVQALVALGYGGTESLKAVRRTSPECATVEDILKEALKYLI